MSRTTQRASSKVDRDPRFQELDRLIAAEPPEPKHALKAHPKETEPVKPIRLKDFKPSRNRAREIRLKQEAKAIRELNRTALHNVEKALSGRGHETAEVNPLERRMDELQAIVSALRERIEIISDWHLLLMERLNKLGARVEAPTFPDPGSFATGPQLCAQHSAALPDQHGTQGEGRTNQPQGLFMTGLAIKSEIFSYLKFKGWKLEQPGKVLAWADPEDRRLYAWHAAFVVELSRELTPKSAA